MDDDELARAVREGLTRQAEQAEPDPAVVGRARAAASRRRRARFAVLGAAAAVALVVGTVVVVTTTRTGDDDAPAGPADSAAPRVTAATDGGDPEPTAWRTEYWRGVQVDVPADWGYGNPGLCGDLPTGTPYVGRPIGVTDACFTPGPDATPTAPYVWFDVPGAGPGVEDLGDGWTRETVEVAGTRVSVAAQDADLRARVLGSVEPGGLCDPDLDGVPEARFDRTMEGGGTFRSAHLCAYRGGDLVYASPVTDELFETTVDAVGGAPAARRCSLPPSEVVVVTGIFDDPYGPGITLFRDVVYDLTCGIATTTTYEHPGGPDHQVTEATVPWATPVFRRLLVGPLSGRWVYGRFIGVQG
ncbi:hypothetical protein GCM10023340_23020 [Nocardioides marinquilinus]|uniref:Septum formation-related domain-containing protein n=1 Tax=Nocardioides marinquilinus TaxID=1210400 RepID=A0ABP9PN03_9ACTN